MLFDGDLKARDERIRILERENAELKAKLQALHRRQFKPNKKKDAETGGKEVEGDSSSNEGKKKKRGAPVGHPGWVRPKPDHIDRTVHVPAPTICPHCQSDDLTPMEERTEHVQEDIVIQPRTLVTRYLHGQAFCARCHRPVVQAGEGELLNAPIGPVAKSVAHLFTLSDRDSLSKNGRVVPGVIRPEVCSCLRPGVRPQSGGTGGADL